MDERPRGYREPAPPPPERFPVRLGTAARVSLLMSLGAIALSIVVVLLTGRVFFLFIAALGPRALLCALGRTPDDRGAPRRGRDPIVAARTDATACLGALGAPPRRRAPLRPRRRDALDRRRPLPGRLARSLRACARGERRRGPRRARLTRDRHALANGARRGDDAALAHDGASAARDACPTLALGLHQCCGRLGSTWLE